MSAAAIGNSLHGMYDSVVSGTGNAMQAMLFGIQAGRGANDILRGFILDETGIGSVIDLAQSIGSYFAPGDPRGAEIAGMAEFYQHFDWAALPLIVDDADYTATDLDDQEPQCFRAGTLVMTENGLCAIETIRAGDQVWAFDESTQGRTLKRVAKTFQRQRTSWLKLGIDETFVEVTAEHPFYVMGKGWVQAGKLSIGDRLLPFDPDLTSTITSIEPLAGTTTVFNFEVEDLHDYFITDEGVLVHNRSWSPAFNHYITRALGSKIPYASRIIQAAGKLNAFRHIRLHRELNAYLSGIRKGVISMMPSRGNPGATIRRVFTPQERLRALSQFYRQYQGGKYFRYFQDELKAMTIKGAGLDPNLFQ